MYNFKSNDKNKKPEESAAQVAPSPNGATAEGAQAPGAAVAGQATGAPQVQAKVVAQYVKDMSFLNPDVDRLLAGPGEDPKMKVEVNVAARKVRDDLFESTIDLKGNASNNGGTIYDLHIVYAGMFRVKNIPDKALEPFLHVNCPVLIFPFLRRMAADVTREGGFPPLLLDPIDFAGLYVRRRKEAVAAQKAAQA